MKDTIPNELGAYYAQRAREYEEIYARPERQIDLHRLREDIPALLAGRHVLEIACGTGYWTQSLAASAASVTGIDINPQTLDVARAKGLPLDRVTFDVADAMHLPARYSGFTGAFAGFWWSHLPREGRRDFIAALHRALQPGAVVVAVDNLFVEGNSTPISHTDLRGNTHQQRKLKDGTEHRVLKNFPSEIELLGDLRGVAKGVSYTAYEYYWLLRYEVA